MNNLAHWEEAEGCTIHDVLYAGTMDVDRNRNQIKKDFLKTAAEWLYWVDADNAFLPGSVRRQMNVALHGEIKRTLVGGMYYSKFNKPWPIAYTRFPDGRYESMSGWKYGEIVPADAMGMHSVLSHRSVYEDIDKSYIVLMRKSGGMMAVHKDDVIGDLPENKKSPNDGKVVDGVYHERLTRVPIPTDLPIFRTEYGRTEDMGFFEMAKRCGHNLWIDTGVESTHQRVGSITGRDFREAMAKGDLTHGEPNVIGG